MEKLNKLTVFDMCVNGSEEGAKERFKDLIGPMFDEFNSFYWALRDTSVRPSDIDVITYRKMGPTIQFTVYATEEAKKRVTGKGFGTQNQGITVHIPITKGA